MVIRPSQDTLSQASASLDASSCATAQLLRGEMIELDKVPPFVFQLHPAACLPAQHAVIN